MFSKEAVLLQQIAESREAIRQKHLQLKSSLHDVQTDVSKFFQPIIKPLNKIASDREEKEARVSFHYSTPYKNRTKSKLSFSDDEEDESVEQESSIFKTVTQTDENDSNNNLTEETDNTSRKDNFDENLVATSVQNYVNELDNRGFNIDTVFGIRKAYGKYMIGNKEVDFKDGKLIVSNEEYPATNGLLELLFRKKVDEKLITEKDVAQYKKIALESDLLRKNFHPNGSLKTPSRHHLKFDTYLWDLNLPKHLKKSNKTGKGLPKFMIARKKESSFDYKYWDDPNELVDRLRLLVAERSAGNNNHNNEILAIIEELREAKIIY